MKFVLVKGTGFFERLIRWQSRSPYSHAAVIDDNGVVYEAVTSGVRSWRGELSRLGDYDLFDVETTPEQADLIKKFLWRQLSKRYDFTMVLRFVSRCQETRKSTGKWFCSELVFAAFQQAGIDLLARTEPWEVSPGLLARSPLATVTALESTMGAASQAG